MNTLDVDSCHSDLPCDSKKLVKRGHLTPSFLIVLKAFYCSNERLTLEKSVLETPIYITNSVDETKLSCSTSTAAVTVSLETYPLFTLVRRGKREISPRAGLFPPLILDYCVGHSKQLLAQ